MGTIVTSRETGVLNPLENNAESHAQTLPLELPPRQTLPRLVFQAEHFTPENASDSSASLLPGLLPRGSTARSGLLPLSSARDHPRL